MDDRMHPPGAPPPQQPVAPQPPLAPPAPQAAQSPNPWGRPEPPAKTPFQLDIRFDSMELSSELGSILESEAPVSKGEIYFANPPAPARPVAAAPASGSRRPKKKRKHSGAVVAGAMALILAASALLSWIGITTLRDIFAIGKVSSQEVSLTLADNLTTDEVIDLLAAKGLITQKWLCKLYSDFSFWMRSRNLSDPSEAKQPVYLGGPHKVESNMSLEELLGAFKSQPKTTETSTLVFPEGYTVRQVVAKIGKYNVATVEELERRLRSTEFDYPFLKELNTERRFNLYEGYLFPDTYEFYIRENSSSVLRRFFDNFNSKWTEEYDTRAQELGMTIDQVITLASIIQMEAANKAQMADISGVLHNRLNHIEAYPMLECDSTRDYVTNNIAINGMDRGTAEYYYQAYNTYQCTGLPTGPICNPGIDAIEAALNPKKHSYYYFQHDRNKKIYLSKTKAEHDKVTTDLV
ncbi:MAG: endolytic transglycosylase MltG, partial [Oscillospiraceae bacterium]|nr:endolytic transglycosylase MltG [Oscillospiraceae bacterium]